MLYRGFKYGPVFERLTLCPLQEGIKEQDKTLIDIFKKVQVDVKELNGFVTNHRSSSSLQGTPITLAPPPQPSPPQP